MQDGNGDVIRDQLRDRERLDAIARAESQVGRMRFAQVSCPDAKTLWAYLPENYVILSGIDPRYLIAGVDVAGWTLDGYVLPRLASGLHYGKELNVEEAMQFIRSQRV